MKKIDIETKAGEVHGVVDEHFSDLADVFIENFTLRDEVGASCALAIEGRTIAELWGGRMARDGKAWEKDTVCTVFSATKGAMSLCAHILADRGDLDLDALVTDYWPEFGAGGKESATVKMALDHSLGVPHIRSALKEGAFYDYDYMVKKIEEEEAFWVPGTRSGYHALTMAWTVGEIVHRAAKQRMGKFFDREIAQFLGVDFWIGAPENVSNRISPMIAAEPDEAWMETRFVQEALVVGETPTHLFMRDFPLMNPNESACHQAEIGSANGITNAQGLAALYEPLACGGLADGKRLVSNDTVARMARTSTASHEDATLLIATRFGLGFMKSTDNRRRADAVNSSLIIGDAAFGHVGAGGSVGFADPECKVSFGYAMNRMGTGILMNPRGQTLIDSVYQTLGYKSSDSGAWVLN